MNDPLYLEDSFGNLGFLQYLRRRKFRSKWRDMLFPNARRMDLKGLVAPISDLWNRFRMALSHKFIGKKARPSSDSVLELQSSEASCSERDSIFYISAFKKALSAICW